uniref:Uncharacterized protein n=1 Tax=Arundo donax TaxID=35708 RepID=A0A0A9HSP8_ARUDO
MMNLGNLFYEFTHFNILNIVLHHDI